MRKITQAVCSAFEAQRPLTTGNSSTDGLALYLHGNKIAQHTSEGLMVSTAGWDTNTTRERLNGLRGVRVYRRKGELILNGKPWDGEMVNIKTWGAGAIA